MPCHYPLEAWRCRDQATESGRSVIKFQPPGEPIKLPCGRCTGCRLEKSRQWAIRCMHEAALWKENSFITLTYRPEDLPRDGSLVKPHFQKFMKRLRKKIAPQRVRFYHCGEYGPKFQRPHYHACLFGYDFPDKVFWKQSPSGAPLYTSELLEQTWGLGFTSVGAVTFESAAYVARYVMKKVNGEKAQEHYWRTDPVTGESVQVEPEYTTMSRRPGIGYWWLQMYGHEVYPEDEVIVNGRQVRPPRYYDGLFEHDEPDVFRQVKRTRKNAAIENREENRSDRLRAKAKVAEARTNNMRRSFEDV